MEQAKSTTVSLSEARYDKAVRASAQAAGFAGGWLDRLTMRVVDILVSFPTILLAIIVITIFGPGLRNAMIAIGIAQVPLYARLTRGAVLKVKARKEEEKK